MPFPFRHARRTAAITTAVCLGAAAIALAGNGNGGNGSGNGNGNGNGNGPPDRSFSISGGLTLPLWPGVTRQLPLTITNPESQPITITELTVTVRAATSRPGCNGPQNLLVTQSNVSAARPLVVPKRGSVTLPSGGITTPAIQMRNLAVSQDACKSATFTFDFSGRASG